MNNWKFYIGKTVSELDRLIVQSGFNFVTVHYPYGRNWMLDVKRILTKEPEIIVDAGANVGSISDELTHFFTNSTIFAFEPVKDTFDTLVFNTAKKSSIYPQHAALGAINEKAVIGINSENTINSLKSELHGSEQDTEEITIIRLDDFFYEKGINKIEILKIDVEGFEFEVLNGCGQLEIDCIYLEVGYERQPTKVHFVDVDTYMEKSGYQLCGIYDLMRDYGNKKKLSYSNHLYIKKNLL